VTLQPGARIGHYEILTAIGKGGMGEVWKARDTKLRRDVAIKALPDSVARDPARRARLEHEAALLAALNHPNIATIHGLEQQDGTSVLVLELVEGNTLDDRLLFSSVPVEEALRLALQLALALEAAHAKDIIHRDLKPSNIKVTPDNRLKVLDFGIAKALAAPSGNETRTVNPTETGAIVGTPMYMSPEQARGEAVGFQSDIWSFGAVLYEMLTGVSPFKRKTGADTLVSVLESQPDYAALPPATPLAARRLVERCLEKDPSRRLRHMQDVRILVEDALASDGADALTAVPSAPHRRWWVAGGLVAAALAGMVVGVLLHRSTPEPPPLHVSIPFAGTPVRFPFGTRHVAISRDASTVAFTSSSGLQIRRLDQKNTVTFAFGTNNPFFSPDGDWVGVFDDRGLLKVPVSGGPPTTVAASTDRPTGGTWRADGTIIFTTSNGLFQVSANGGERKVIAKPDRSHKETFYAWPQFLPDGRSVVFTIVSEGPNESLQTVRLDLTSGERRTVLRGSSAVYVPSGYLIYAAGATLNAVAFDAARGEVTGKPVSFPGIDVSVAPDNGAADFAISDTGTLVLGTPATPGLGTLEWIDRHGTRQPLAFEPQTYRSPMVSPDGTRVAVERTTNGNRDIWMLDLKRGTQTQLTDGPTEDALPVWSADGRRVFFGSNRSGTFNLYSQAADGASSAKLEFGGPEAEVPQAVTPDGTRLIVYERYKDLVVLDFAKPDRLEPLLHSDFDERLGEVSSDGKWIAYESDESGTQFEIILRAFPNVGERREIVSVNGGRYPRWGPKGSNELYYVDLNGAMMAVPIVLSPKLALGRPVKLFDWQKPAGGRSFWLYDVAPDGRFLVTKPVAPNPNSQTNVSLILNWLTTLGNRRP